MRWLMWTYTNTIRELPFALQSWPRVHKSKPTRISERWKLSSSLSSAPGLRAAVPSCGDPTQALTPTHPWRTQTGQADNPTATGTWSTALKSGPTTAGSGTMWNAGPSDVPSVRLISYQAIRWFSFAKSINQSRVMPGPQHFFGRDWTLPSRKAVPHQSTKKWLHNCCPLWLINNNHCVSLCGKWITVTYIRGCIDVYAYDSCLQTGTASPIGYQSINTRFVHADQN